ncbi:MAG TPA: phage holin family protein [Candidatus Limnocylindria bacterium]|nr:phage holin family protein [Candidatus Limnocylindria bacterium]
MTDPPPPHARPSAFALARRFVGELIGLARLELRHLAQELGEMWAETKRGIVLVLVAVSLLVAAFVVLVLSIVLLLAAITGLPDWAAALIVLAGLLVLAALLGYRGMRHFKVGPPEETIASVKEEVAWAKRLLRRG